MNQKISAPISVTRYLRTVFLVALGSLPLLAAFCYAMDAYRVFDVPLRPGWNDVKGADNERLAYAYALRREPVSTLLLGNSRLRAFDPPHPVFDGERALAVRLAGTNIWELEHYFHHALAVAPVRRALLLVDFVNFNAMDAPTRERPGYLVGPDGDPDALGPRLVPLGPVLFSLDGLSAACTTLVESARGEAVDDGGPEAGTRRIFRLTERRFARAGGAYTPGLAAAYRFEDPRGGESSFAPFARILAAAHRHDVDLRLVMSPSHARMWQVVDSLGLWPQWEAWKRRIVAENERVAAEQGRTRFPLWDFSGFNAITTEAVPAPGGAPMRFYEETSHYSRVVGGLVLERVFGDGSGPAPPPGFGVRLRPESLDAHLAAIRAARDAWQQTHAEDVREVETEVL